MWDPENKKWINTDQDVTEEEAFKPPPKMADLTRSAIPSMPAMPAMSAPVTAPGVPTMPLPATTPVDSNQLQNANAYGLPAPHADASANNNTIDQAKVPSLQSNMFKMQRNKSESPVMLCGYSEILTNIIQLQLSKSRTWTSSIHPVLP